MKDTHSHFLSQFFVVVTLLLTCILLMTTTLPAATHLATPSVCDQFPESLVRTVFPIPAGQVLQNSAGDTCRWAWTKEGRSQDVSINFLRSARPATIDLLYTRMRDGLTQEVRGQQVTIAPKQVEWVSGVGEKAFWNTDLSQLAVYAKQRLFYVNVNIDGMTKTQKIQSTGDAAKAIIKGL